MRAILILLALVIATVFSCKKSVEPSSSPFVEWHRCVEKKYGNDQVRTCFDALIENSRCPIGAMCVWQGRAVVKLSFTVNDNQQDVTLSTLDLRGSYHSDTTVMGYKIELLGVHPYPQIGVTRNISDYKAELRITKQ